MNFKLPFLTLLFLIMAQSVCPSATKVAVLHSDEFSSFWLETRQLEKVVPVEHFTVSDLARLSESLPQYGLVVIGTQAAYDAKRDFGEYHQAWDGFVRGGGIVLMLDANYEETTARVLGHLAGGTPTARWECGNSEEAGQVTPLDSALFCHPYVGGTADFPFAIRSGAHFTAVPEGWCVVATCRHGNPILVEHPLGDGAILATTLFAMFSVDGKLFLRSLACNLLFRQECRRAGVELEDFRADYSSENALWHLTLKNCSDAPKTISGRAVVNGASLVRLETRLAPNESHTFQGELPKVGESTVGVVLNAPEPLVFTGNFQAPDLTPQFHLPARVFAADLSRISLPLQHKVPATFTAVKLSENGHELPCHLASPHAEAVLCDLSSLAPGSHRLRMELTAEDDTVISLPEQQTTLVPPEQMKLSTDVHGNLLRDGRLFFPLAWYHVSRAQGVTAEDRAECLEYAATYGYNTILMLTYGTAEDDAFMDEAARLGIAIFCAVRSYDEIQEKAARWPAAVGWLYEMDEPEHWGYSPEEVKRNADKIFSLAPGCPTFSSMETVATIQRYAGVTDIFSTTGYPVPACPLRLVSDKFRLLVKLASQYGFIPMATVQCFGYPGCQGEGYPVLPTPRQVRNMVYQALAANLKGLNFYTYSDGNFRLRKHPELDELMRKIPSEITPLLTFLQLGDYEELLQGDAQGIVGARWTMGDQVLQLWINTTEEIVSLNSPEWQDGFAPVNGSQGKPAHATLSLAPEEVVVWRR